MRRRAPHAAAFAAVLAALLVFAGAGSGATTVAEVGPLPQLGTADPATVLIGAAADGEPGEAWGYRQLPPAVGGARVGSRRLELSATTTSRPQLAFLRHRDGSGWQVFETPLDEAGSAYLGPAVPNRLSARITPRGGGVLVGRDLARPVGQQAVVLRRDPGGRWRAMQPPPPEVLPPADAERPAEALAADGGAGAVAVAAYDGDAGTGLFFGPQGRAVADGVVHFDGAEWRREPVCMGEDADPCEPPAERLRLLAIDATGPANAWALAEGDPALGLSLVLLERELVAGAWVWAQRSLGASPFARRESPADQVAAVAPLGGNAQPLTVTADGAWIDLAAEIAGAERDVTLFYSASAGALGGAWCDAGLCDGGLGIRFSRQSGYRSFAWAGEGFGTRIVTNPLDPGGGEDTNRGSYLRFEAGAFTRLPGVGGNFRPSGAFASADSGWLGGPVEVSAAPPPSRLEPWPIAVRAPLTAVTGGPGAPAAAPGSAALAVGLDGSVLRYEPGGGWRREFLLSSGGSVSRAALRGVAWPEAARAHAVGDLGAIWVWNAADGLWAPDPGAPIGFEGNLMGIAFDPGDPFRGYAVGKGGVLLEYGKSWEPAPLPAGLGRADLTSIAFAGRQAIVAAGRDLLVGDGGGWRVDESARALLDTVRAGDPRLLVVAGLADGGAVAAGRDIVIERDGPGASWRFADQPILGSTAIAAAAVRAGPAVRAVVSVVPQLSYPLADDLPEPDPNVPPPIPPPFGLPGDGYLLRETASGWRDEQRTAFAGTAGDRPLKSDPVLALLLDAGGDGWAVGGWSGDADSAGRGSSAREGTGRTIRERVRTGAVFRYGDGAAAPTASTRVELPMPAGPVRLAVAGHAECDAGCADLARHAIGPDRTLAAALEVVAGMRGAAGPRALLYTGNRVRTGLGAADAARYARLLGGGAVPVFPALGSNDALGGLGAGAFREAFAAFPAPFGSGAPAAGIGAAGIPGAAPGPGARTHYAFDSAGPGGLARVIVIDNSLGSLAASDPHQNPPEPQLPWLEAVLADARTQGIPTVVMGSRSLNPNFTPRLNVAADATEVARVLVAGGASAYLFDRPEENRAMRIPAGAAETIPSFGVGTLGYRSQIAGAVGLGGADALFGDSGVLLLELDAGAREPATNRAPVGVRLVPVIEDLALEATDGTLLRRSRPALFRGLGRRPRGGDRWGRVSSSGNPNPAGGDPYTLFPPAPCLQAGCAARIAPEYTFASSDPDIADFVRQDPASTNLRKPYLDEGDRVVTDNGSSLLCPFNAGTTTVTVSAGGYSHSERVTVQGGSVQRPCGTRPLRPDRFKQTGAATAPPAPPPPPGSPPGNPPLQFAPPAPPPATVPVAPPPPPPAAPPPDPFIPLALGLAAVPAIVPPPAPPVARPMPPGGAPARVYQVEEEREEEAAIEESHAFSRYEASDAGAPVPPQLLGLVLIAALGAAGARRGPGPGARRRPAPAFTRPERNRRSRR